MALKKFYLHRDVYLTKLAKTLQKASKNGDMLPSRHSNEAAYFIEETGALLFYDGKNTFFIGARSQETIRRTKSKLERMADVKLTQF